MDVNFFKMHNPNNPAKKFAGKSHLGRYSDSVLELDDNIGRIMDVIRAEAPDTIVITTADNGAWQDAYPDAGTHPFRGEKGSAFEAGWRVPGIMWWPDHIPAGAKYDEMMSHIDCWATLASMVGSNRRRTANGKTTTASRSTSTALTTAPTSWARPSTRRGIRGSTSTARISWVRGLTLAAIPTTTIYTSRGSTSIRPRTPGLARQQNLGSIGSLYYLTMDPFEKYDMVFNGAMSSRMQTSSPGHYAGEDNGWVLSLIYPVIIDFDKSDREVSKHQAIPGRRVERPDTGSSASGKPGAAGRSEQGAARERWTATKRFSGDTTINLTSN